MAGAEDVVMLAMRRNPSSRSGRDERSAPRSRALGDDDRRGSSRRVGRGRNVARHAQGALRGRRGRRSRGGASGIVAVADGSGSRGRDSRARRCDDRPRRCVRRWTGYPADRRPRLHRYGRGYDGNSRDLADGARCSRWRRRQLARPKRPEHRDTATMDASRKRCSRVRS